MHCLSLDGVLAGAFMLRIQPVRCTGLIHDLVEELQRGGEGRAAAFQLQYGYDPRCNVHCCSVPYLPHMPSKI